MLRWLLRLLLVLALMLPVGLGVLLWLLVERAPLVESTVVFSPDHIARARLLWQRNDPRRMRPGVVRTVMVSEADLDLAANYAASRYARGGARIALRDGAASVRATFTLPANPIGRYVNLDASLVETEGLPQVAALRIGSVRVPAAVCNWLLDRGITRLRTDADTSAVADVVKHIGAGDGMLRVTYEWSDVAAAQIKSVLVPPAEQARWQAYQARLVEVTSRTRHNRPLTLDTLLGPLMQLAAERAAHGDGVLEHRAALVVLAFYINGKGLSALVPGARSWPRPPWRYVTLAGRRDLPQHFTISAALAATAGSPLSDAVGLYKEVDDARRGSGFSFPDIAADRAGTRFGELAVGPQDDGSRLRALLARGLTEADLLPEVKDLPEFLSEAEFGRRFGGVGEPPYLKLMAEIERRVAALPLYQ